MLCPKQLWRNGSSILPRVSVDNPGPKSAAKVFSFQWRFVRQVQNVVIFEEDKHILKQKEIYCFFASCILGFNSSSSCGVFHFLLFFC